MAVVFDAAIFADAQKDDAVDGGLDGDVEFALCEAPIAQRDVACQELAPFLDLGEEGVVDLGGAAFLGGGLDVFVEGAFADGVWREDGCDFVPATRVS